MLEILLLVHVVAAILATLSIFRADYFERRQAIAQTLVSGCVPLVGPVLILVFQSVVHRNMTSTVKPDSENHYRDEGLAADLRGEVVAGSPGD